MRRRRATIPRRRIPQSQRTPSDASLLGYMDCGREDALDAHRSLPRVRCLLDVVHDLDALRPVVSRELFDQRLASWDPPDRSGVWRYRG